MPPSPDFDIDALNEATEKALGRPMFGYWLFFNEDNCHEVLAAHVRHFSLLVITALLLTLSRFRLRHPSLCLSLPIPIFGLLQLRLSERLRSGSWRIRQLKSLLGLQMRLVIFCPCSICR